VKRTIVPGLIENVACPLCGKGFRLDGNHVTCPERHAFDFARSGYLNLLPVQHRHSKEPGDDRRMVSARHAFLEKRHYERLAECVSRHITGELKSFCTDRVPVVLDAGCGEGYYLARLASDAGKGLFYGIDISRWAVQEASRSRARGNILWIVAGVRRIPLKDGSADTVISIFSKDDCREFSRVLRPGGSLVLVGPGEKHLQELRRQLYDEVFPVQDFEDRLVRAKGLFRTVGMDELVYETEIAGEGDIDNLISMTPYAWKSPRERLSAARKLQRLTVSVAARLAVLRRV
jgi:23S rRNA (guanine745-N1)-methyltransferase